ncbi:MAG: DUF262 domain-containing protein [Gammaproteobacteria bacterium]|nr:DUF262 domain-containing protein [Gammaproteobacteria bacterium]
MKVRELLDGIRKSDIVLPEFQREYVWTLDQAKQLMVSLARGYPVGGILLWKTDAPPELKNVDTLPDRLGTAQVLLDGQQRLTTLHMLLTGDIPSFYTAAEIQNDPRNLFVNLQDLDFQYYQASRMRGDPHWQRVIDCFDTSQVNPLQIASDKAGADDGADVMVLAQHLLDNLNRIRNINEVDLPEQVVPSDADLDEAINIFDRINSQGTKLTDAELALTHITGKWPRARRAMKAKAQECGERGFDFSLTFMTRALTTAVTKRALFEAVHSRPRDELEAGWTTLTRILDYLLTILPPRAFVHSTSDLNTTNALIPLVAHLAINRGRFADESSIHHAINWLYAALMWGRYTGQTDQRLEADVQLVVRETEPWDALRANIAEQRGRIDVKAADFEGRGVQHALYRAIFILAKAQSAVDWFNGLPLAQTHGTRYGIHSHHIFPQARLYAQDEWDSDNYMHRQVVNEIANRAFLTAETNIELSATPPADYLPAIEDRHPGALAAQFVPMDPQLWHIERFPDFLAARREIMARKLNEFMASLIDEPERTHQRPITDLISLGESYVLEFKSSLQWDAVKNEPNKALRQASLKTVNALLNSQGGTLVIGVEDDGSIYGLDRDLSLTRGSRDRFEQLVATLVADSMGASTAAYFKVRFEDVEERSVCVVDVERSPEPVFLTTPKGRVFYIRVGNTSRALDHEETLKYVEANWDH